MLMVENRTADNRKIAVAADEEMREKINEIHEGFQSLRSDGHRNVLMIENDAMMRIIDVRRILKVPALARQSERDDPDVFASRMARRPFIADVFFAEQAFRVARGFARLQKLGDVFVVLLRFREVDRNLERRALIVIRQP